MSAPVSNADRVRASRLRSAVKRGARLAPPDAAWLESYERSYERRRGPKVIDLAPIDERPKAATAPKKATTDTPEEENGHIDGATSAPPENYASATWIPIAPPVPDADGTTQPNPEPAAGVDPAKAEQTAAKIGALLGALTAAGIGAAKELAAAGTLPGAELIVGLDNKTTLEAVKYVSAAGQRLVHKYGVSVGFDYEDEIVVLGAVAGSVAAIAKVRADAAQRALPVPVAGAQGVAPAAGEGRPAVPPSARGSTPTVTRDQPKDAKAAQAFAAIFGTGGL